MGKAQREKGARSERKIVERLNGLPGVSAVRVPLSGACAGFKGDIKAFVYALGATLQVEVKARARAAGFKMVRDWLEGNELLFLSEDREEPLVAMPYVVFEAIIRGLADGGRAADRRRGEAEMHTLREAESGDCLSPGQPQSIGAM